MNKQQQKKISKLLSLVLRHKPQAIGIQLDENGWADVATLLSKITDQKFHVSMDDLKLVVTNNDKQRFIFNEDYSSIRANQGHSIEVNVELEQMIPPNKLYHGTSLKNKEDILVQGLSKMNRQHVHLSADTSTAVTVGGRHGKPIVFIVDTKRMHEDGKFFYKSKNGVWLCDAVAPIYLSIKE